MEYVILHGTKEGEWVFWNNREGWTDLSDATIFTEEETKKFTLPMGQPVAWMSKDVAETLNK